MRVEAVTMTRMWNGFGTVEKLCVLDICVHFCENWFFVLSCMNFVCMNLKLVYINCRTKWRDPARTRHNPGRGIAIRTRHNPSWNRSRYALNKNLGWIQKIFSWFFSLKMTTRPKIRIFGFLLENLTTKLIFLGIDNLELGFKNTNITLRVNFGIVSISREIKVFNLIVVFVIFLPKWAEIQKWKILGMHPKHKPFKKTINSLSSKSHKMYYKWVLFIKIKYRLPRV